MFLYGSADDHAAEFGALIRTALIERAFLALSAIVPAPLMPIVGVSLMMDAQDAIASATFTNVTVHDCDGRTDTLACERCGALDVDYDVIWPDTGDAPPPEFYAHLEPNSVRVPIRPAARL